jgi:coproporphyrinogen III oxidase
MELDAYQQRVAHAMYEIQAHICAGLEQLEHEAGGAARFVEDRWERPGGGGGVSRVLQDGDLFEKGGVNVSVVHGALSEAFANELPGAGSSFFATGVSLVIHPRNPHVPTVHANFRHIVHGERRWFGGGADLTPYYVYAEDTKHFHAVWKEYCDAYPDIADYAAFNNWCERYFYNTHREEHRGVGGIFFDDLLVDHRPGHDPETLLSFVRTGGMRFLDAYAPIVRRRMNEPFTAGQREWQLIRRGRYVEFNLIHDRGTVFGLKTGGRTESILMSLPPHAMWRYGDEPAPNSPEAALMEVLRRPLPTASQ